MSTARRSSAPPKPPHVTPQALPTASLTNTAPPGELNISHDDFIRTTEPRHE